MQTLHVYDNRSLSRAASIYAYLPPEPVVGFNISHPRLLFLALRAPKRTLWAASIYAYLPPEPVVGFNIRHLRLLFLALRATQRTL